MLLLTVSSNCFFSRKGTPWCFTTGLNEQFESIKDIKINDNFEFGILGCNNIVHFFNRNGEKIKSINSVIKDSYFLISFLDDWLVFNKDGKGISIKSQEPVSIPNSCTPIIDMTSKNKSIAILSKDHILVMNFDN